MATNLHDLRAMGPVLAMAVLAGAASDTTWAADAAAGQKLHDAYCLSCHRTLGEGDENRLYLRADRRVQSFQSLLAQVRRCEQNLGLGWDDQKIDDVAAYLNAEFYKY